VPPLAHTAVGRSPDNNRPIYRIRSLRYTYIGSMIVPGPPGPSLVVPPAHTAARLPCTYRARLGAQRRGSTHVRRVEPGTRSARRLAVLSHAVTRPASVTPTFSRSVHSMRVVHLPLRCHCSVAPRGVVASPSHARRPDPCWSTWQRSSALGLVLLHGLDVARIDLRGHVIASSRACQVATAIISGIDALGSEANRSICLDRSTELGSDARGRRKTLVSRAGVRWHI